MENIDQLLELTCKAMIKTILACLDNATKGTVYRIGPIPGLTATRITSGIRSKDSDEIIWGLPAASDYNPPGKDWEQYRDQPGRVLEAMGWCVARQKSWTAENPFEDVRSVRKQLSGEVEDFYHMEPVLVRKADLYVRAPDLFEYPLDAHGSPIWQDTEFVVVAVIKIHFEPYTIQRENRSTRIIRELSRSLGTELLSLHLREKLLTAQKEFARQRLQSCEILAHELRNTLIKMGFIFSAVNAQIGIIREAWEQHLRTEFPRQQWKETVLEKLNQLIHSRLPRLPASSDMLVTCESLLIHQTELATLSIVPQQGELWITNRIRPRWEELLARSALWKRAEVMKLLEQLGKSLKLGMDPGLISKVNGVPPLLAQKWAGCAYTYITAENLRKLDEIIDFLGEGTLPVPYKFQIRKVLKSLKALIETIPEVEETATKIVHSLRYGIGPEIEVPADLERMFAFRGHPDEFGLAD